MSCQKRYNAFETGKPPRGNVTKYQVDQALMRSGENSRVVEESGHSKKQACNSARYFDLPVKRYNKKVRECAKPYPNDLFGMHVDELREVAEMAGIDTEGMGKADICHAMLQHDVKGKPKTKGKATSNTNFKPYTYKPSAQTPRAKNEWTSDGEDKGVMRALDTYSDDMDYFSKNKDLDALEDGARWIRSDKMDVRDSADPCDPGEADCRPVGPNLYRRTKAIPCDDPTKVRCIKELAGSGYDKEYEDDGQGYLPDWGFGKKKRGSKKCRKSLVNHHFLLRDKKGKLCKKSAKKH